ncbi:hypothetical protein ACQCQ7_24690, partial [Ralstonia pseudosolanacearum]
ARETLITATRVAPENAQAQANLGDIYVRLAAQSYQNALRLSPKHAAARARLDALPDLPGMRAVPSKPAAEPPAASGVNARPAKR